ncbi:MAG TPA: MAPEG family protein, partial [Arenimonas sp.]|nr:MAPEG family protein [Arenimonas sp.]
TPQAGQVLLALAWLYVVLRVVHSIIQCSYNKVMHRFYVFFTSVWVLLGIWVMLAVGYIR